MCMYVYDTHTHTHRIGCRCTALHCSQTQKSRMSCMNPVVCGTSLAVEVYICVDFILILKVYDESCGV